MAFPEGSVANHMQDEVTNMTKPLLTQHDAIYNGCVREAFEDDMSDEDVNTALLLTHRPNLLTVCAVCNKRRKQ